jgi:uncharacterized membrane protein HdeD (DUF308 family)
MSLNKKLYGFALVLILAGIALICSGVMTKAFLVVAWGIAAFFAGSFLGAYAVLRMKLGAKQSSPQPA